MKIGIFYGSSTGTTAEVAEKIAKQLGVDAADVYDVAKVGPSKFGEYDMLVLGSSTYGSGELQDDWYDMLDGAEKLIEEPYSDTLFLMSSNSPREILPTIYSRTQRIDVTRYSDNEIAAILSGRHAVATEEAEAVAPLADGDITKALRLVSTDKTKAVYLDLFIRLMRLAYTRKVGELRKWSVEVAALGREGSMRFYDYCAHLVRENFILNIGDLNLVSMAPDELEFSRRFSPFINVVNVERIFDTLTAARNDTGLNANGKIVAFDLAVKMILLIKQGQE